MSGRLAMNSVRKRPSAALMPCLRIGNVLPSDPVTVRSRRISSIKANGCIIPSPGVKVSAKYSVACGSLTTSGAACDHQAHPRHTGDERKYAASMSPHAAVQYFNDHLCFVSHYEVTKELSLANCQLDN